MSSNEFTPDSDPSDEESNEVNGNARNCVTLSSGSHFGPRRRALFRQSVAELNEIRVRIVNLATEGIQLTHDISTERGPLLQHANNNVDWTLELERLLEQIRNLTQTMVL